MASNQLVILAIVAIVVLPTLALATEYIVGDDNGWKNNSFDYQAWAKDKEFYVGDTLVFRYTESKHNVYGVTGEEFKACKAPLNQQPKTSGNDKIVLSSPGRKWYICGIGNHCAEGGMKLVIEVKAAAPAPAPSAPAPSAPAPSVPASPNYAQGVAASGFQVLIAATVAIALIMVA